ncbi:anti-sigma B factor RsbW [Weizmannia coagulans]|uniref:Serine-protein kinase RsbW n=3 Tax=Heyndrickxia TaxID=2837504 RepID=A0A0C5C2Z4_HEYCO|nr:MULTISPECIES: anti-sigma B factor RsbW [Heyndrickxia]AEP00717.1 putative anti-sigma regulatory factor, serine/threonine protein kinase [Heyndrickxia coagulans 36D1]AJO21091.1 anti-sigma regulatory factor, serine/threonine protein kinase [Heyndrickxia coagulans]AKN53269.1 Serine-protein kinase RsbW [Heyndrickxia coagulans]APB37568.1 anti-sigma B factor RsbW [Heyndrickxia coagulans]ATW81756.1 anti-sigma B factor RsbW [Heyndrickxia coagulans]
MEEFDHISMKIPAKAEYVGVIRLTISGIASRMGFDYELIEDLKIAASEAITNAVQHAYKDKEDGEVSIDFSLYPDRLEVMVSDNGDSFDLEKVRELAGPYTEDVQIEFMREGGLGLYLIESLMDEVRIHYDGGITVMMTKYLQGEQVETNVKTAST